MDFSRIEAFFSKHTEIEVHSHNPEVAQRPSYMRQYLQKMAVVGLIGLSAVSGFGASPNALANEMSATLAASNTQAMEQIVPASAKTPDASRLQDFISGKRVLNYGNLSDLKKDHPEEYASVKEVKDFHAKYLSEGRGDVQRVFSANAPKEISMKAQATQHTLDHGQTVGSCIVDNLTHDYSHFRQNFDTKYDVGNSALMRAGTAIHEAAHCNTMIHVMKAIGKEEFSGEVDDYKILSLENVADSIAVLTIARVDGVAAAQEMLNTRLEQSIKYRDVDPLHDVEHSMRSIQNILDKHPEMYKTDAAVFKTGIEVGVEGAMQTIASQYPPAQRETAYAELKVAAATINKGYQDAIVAHSNGPIAQSEVQIVSPNIGFNTKNEHQLQQDAKSARTLPTVSAQFLSYFTSMHLDEKKNMPKPK